MLGLAHCFEPPKQGWKSSLWRAGGGGANPHIMLLCYHVIKILKIFVYVRVNIIKNLNLMSVCVFWSPILIICIYLRFCG